MLWTTTLVKLHPVCSALCVDSKARIIIIDNSNFNSSSSMDDDDNGPSRSDGQAIHAVVLVLGDIGRSPRMQYHVKSLLSYRYLQCGANTNITPPPPPTHTSSNSSSNSSNSSSSSRSSSSSSSSSSGSSSSSCSPGVHIHVTVVGYQGEKTIDFTSGCSCSSRGSINSNVTEVDMQYIPTFSFNALRRISILHALCKGIALLIAIIHILMFKIKPYEVIIIQNPPCLPALIASIVVLWLRGNSSSRIVVDWHNLGFSMFAERLGPSHVLVKLSRFLEYAFTSRAQYHLCVSDAMKQWLQREFSVHPVVLYDRPPDIFRRAPIDVQLRHDLLRRIGLTDLQLFRGETSSSITTRVVARDDEVSTTTRCGGEISAAASSIEDKGCTIQTMTHSSHDHDLYVVSGQMMRLRTLREGRVGVLISSTSWTEDEDFELLLDALLQVEAYLQQSTVTLSGYSRLVVLITGKGPLRCSFEKRVEELTLQGRINQCVAVRTLWLSIEDYPQLLRCADLGTYPLLWSQLPPLTLLYTAVFSS